MNRNIGKKAQQKNDGKRGDCQGGDSGQWSTKELFFPFLFYF
jgi:hypothetical protein